MSERQYINFQRAENQRDHQQAYWYAIGVEALAKVAISESKKENETINLSQPWALEEQVFPLEYGEATGLIRDMQACYNLNVLSNVQHVPEAESRPYLVRVLQLLAEQLKLDNYQAEVIADSVREFVDKSDRAESDYGVEDASYEALKPPYLAPNGPLADNSELRAVQQVDGKAMLALAPQVCAIPSDDWRLNVNTLNEQGAALLVALFSPHLSGGDARALIENRPFDGWSSVADFLAESAIAAVESSVRERAKGYLSVSSNYFELDAQVLVNESRVRIRSLLYSNNGDDVVVIRRRFGGISE
jgi:general secretion pathway protein K